MFIATYLNKYEREINRVLFFSGNTSGPGGNDIISWLVHFNDLCFDNQWALGQLFQFIFKLTKITILNRLVNIHVMFLYFRSPIAQIREMRVQITKMKYCHMIGNFGEALLKRAPMMLFSPTAYLTSYAWPSVLLINRLWLIFRISLSQIEGSGIQ